MAEIKISQLPAATTPLGGTEEVPLVQSATTKKVTVSGLFTSPTLVTPALGTPTAVNLTNATNVPVNQATGTLAVAHGGTGQTTYTNGQLLIGNTGTTGLTKATLTAGTNVTITNGAGTITIASATTGDVFGPSSATDNALTRFDSVSGKLIQNSTVTLDDTGNLASPLSIQMGNGSAVTLAAGKLWYDNANGSWNMGMGNGNISQQVGEEIFVYGKATSTISGTLLQAIYKTGTVGASGVVTFAPTVAGITDSNLIIGVATEALATNGFGRITYFGVVHGVNTSGSTYSETWADNDVIWYNPVTGGLTKTKPVAPNVKIQIGTVLNASSGGAGSFQVDIQHGSVLGGTDSNVQLDASPANGSLLQYDSGVSYWKNVAASAVTVGAATSATYWQDGGAGKGAILGPTTTRIYTLPDADCSIGYLGTPQNSQSDNYTLVLADSGKQIFQTGASKTVTIPANASVAFPIGATITIAADANAVTIAITSDSLRWAQGGSLGSRTLAAYGIATITKTSATEWRIFGTGLT